MGALTIAEAYGPTLEQALDDMLAPATAQADSRLNRQSRTCVVCAGTAHRVELADRSIIAVCRDCGSSVRSDPPPPAAGSIPAAASRPPLRLVR